MKKLISAVLVLTLVLTLAPAAFAADVDPDDATYDNTVHIHPVITITGSAVVDGYLKAVVSGVTAEEKAALHYWWYRVVDGEYIPIAPGNDSDTYICTAFDEGYQVACAVTADAPYNIENADFLLSNDPSKPAVIAATGVVTVQQEMSLWQKIWRWWMVLMTSIQRLINGLTF